MVGGAPLLVKLVAGTQGTGVVLCDTAKAAQSVMEAFIQTNNYLLVQEYIQEANGADIRCLVVGGKVVAAMRRQAQSGEFRSNLHRGGVATAISLTPAEAATAVHAAAIMGLDVAGVDMLRSARGPLVLEVNSSPGLQGIESASGQDVASAIMILLEQRVHGQALVGS
jgi:ribosomal protein S6--L-glutamate ligase